jgi:hypothetical protein
MRFLTIRMVKIVDIQHFSAMETLCDGTQVTVRAVRSNDKDKLVTAFRALEPETLYTRFFQHKSESLSSRMTGFEGGVIGADGVELLQGSTAGG